MLTVMPTAMLVAGRLQRACLELLRCQEQDGERRTRNGFVYCQLKQASHLVICPATGCCPSPLKSASDQFCCSFGCMPTVW
jgi:hypothetical protein